MPEPTDHRAEAEEMLQLAHVGSHGLEVSQLQALIGIGHALLALGQQPREAPAWRLYRPPWRPLDTRCESRFHGERCVLYASHRGDHRLTWTPVD